MQVGDARDRTAGEESDAAQARVSHQDAVLPQREHGVDVHDFARSLSLPGKHIVRRAIRAQDDQFAVPVVRDDGAAVREEAADVDSPESVVARVGAVSVPWLCGEAEGGGGGWRPLIRDNPYARAVLGLDRDITGLRGVAPARPDPCHQYKNEVASAWHPTLPPAGTSVFAPWPSCGSTGAVG